MFNKERLCTPQAVVHRLQFAYRFRGLTAGAHECDTRCGRSAQCVRPIRIRGQARQFGAGLLCSGIAIRTVLATDGDPAAAMTPRCAAGVSDGSRKNISIQDVSKFGFSEYEGK
jgi:hypothetical protein